MDTDTLPEAEVGPKTLPADRSAQVGQLVAAIAKAQGQFVNPPRDREVKVKTKAGDTYTFRYATLSAVMDMIRNPLAENGLALTFHLGSDEQGTILTTRISFGEEWIQTWMPVLIADGANMQAWGSSTTYAKRYGICTLLAIAADEDDDGNQSAANEAQPIARPTRKPTATPKPAAKPAAAAETMKQAIKDAFYGDLTPRERANAVEKLAQAKNINESQLKWMRDKILSTPDEPDVETVNKLVKAIDDAILDRKPDAPPDNPAPPTNFNPNEFTQCVEQINAYTTLAECDEFEGITLTLLSEPTKAAVKKHLDAHRAKLEGKP